MKKILLSFLSLMLALFLCFSGVACSNVTLLAFSDKWNDGNSSNHKGITETAIYSVTCSDNYNNLIKKTEIPKDVLDFSYSNGKYVQVLTTSTSLPFENTLGDELTKDSLFYHLHTELTVDLTAKTNTQDEPINHTDTVISDAYFLSAGQSFAPIYSSTKVENAYIATSAGENAQAQVQIFSYEWNFVYSQNSYKMTAITKGKDGDVTTEKTFNYSYKSAIDNTQLLFAARNIEVDEKNSYRLPTISPSYGEPKTLLFSCNENPNSTYRNTIKFTSPKKTLDKEMEIPVRTVKFLIDSNRDTGAYHYVNIQTKKTDDIPHRALMTEYAAPIISYGAFQTLGAMVYKLTEVKIEQA